MNLENFEHFINIVIAVRDELEVNQANMFIRQSNVFVHLIQYGDEYVDYHKSCYRFLFFLREFTRKPFAFILNDIYLFIYLYENMFQFAKLY